MNKILVFGDSISYGKWDKEGGWVQRLRSHIDEKYNLAEESSNFQIYNLGIPGEVIVRMVNRVEAELLMRIDPEEDNLVIYAIGINDSNKNNAKMGKQTQPDEFKQTLHKLIDVAEQHKCKTVFIGLTPTDESKSKGMLFNDKDVQEFDQYITEICKERNIEKLHLFDKLVGANFSQYLVDSVHPNTEGHKVLFEEIRLFLQNEGYIE